MVKWADDTTMCIKPIGGPHYCEFHSTSCLPRACEKLNFVTDAKSLHIQIFESEINLRDDIRTNIHVGVFDMVWHSSHQLTTHQWKANTEQVCICTLLCLFYFIYKIHTNIHVHITHTNFSYSPKCCSKNTSLSIRSQARVSITPFVITAVNFV